MNKIWKAVAFLAGLGVASLAQAAAYSYSAVVDLHQSTVGETGVILYSLPANPPTFSLHGTDTITGTVSFADGKALQIKSPIPNILTVGSIRLRFDPASTSSVNYSSTVTLLGVSGSLATPNPQNSGYGVSNGGVLDAAFSGLTNNTLSFTGFTYTITLNAPPPHVDFQPASLRLDAVNELVSIVPEPSIGLAMLAGSSLLIRRRK